MTPIFCSIADASAMLGIGRTKTYELITTKKLTLVKIGARSLVEVASIDKLSETLLKEVMS
jgi:excisionase family DNA binding protein